MIHHLVKWEGELKAVLKKIEIPDRGIYIGGERA